MRMGSPLYAPAVVMVVPPEYFSDYLACGNAGHDDHGAEGDVLHNHRHPFIAAILGHKASPMA